MGNALEYVKGILSDRSGMPSSKRVIALAFSILLGVAFVANLGWGLTIADNILDATMLVIIAGLGLTGIEKFAPLNSKKDASE
jgi:hypothetical protein